MRRCGISRRATTGGPRAAGVQDTPLGVTLADSYSRDELSSTMVPNFPETLNAMLEKGPEATICSRRSRWPPASGIG
jgi:hypothetical protein